ncbi:MAG TPA: group III truncated hemoglobin [Flavobacterium sp.]|jgi:hemoglobin
MRDIETRQDIALLMESFYTKLLQDSTISYIFTDVAKIDLQEHLPHLIDFWEEMILGSSYYNKNVMKIHLDLNEKMMLQPLHFQTWLRHFDQTIDESFSGSKAEQMKTRALSIATFIQAKVSSQ